MNNARRTGFLAALLTVMRKELRDFTRDRKTLLLTLLMGPLVYPIMMLGMGKLSEMRRSTQLEKPLAIAIVGHQRVPNLTAFLASQGITAMNSPPGDVEAAIRAQDQDVALVIDEKFDDDWAAGRPARVTIVADSTRRNADIPVARVNAALDAYSQTTGATRLLARGINPGITRALGVDRKDMATPEAKRGVLLSVVMPLILLILAFIGGAHLSMDTTAGERERQSLEPLLATPASRAALVSGKMLAAALVGITSLVLTLLAFKLSANLAGTGMARMMDVSLPAIAGMLLILLPLVLIGTALLTFLSANSKSMKEAQAQMTWLLFLPMVPAYALMAYPLKDTELWQYAVPFLSQNQMLAKVSRGEMPGPEQWAVYLAAALALATALWAAAVWRYKQEKLAIAS
ncbi:ABC transporter permease [Lysobacter pythonis]|uniref:ABC transporter permease n=1 Tax=Solilutibacter pythonis TaxID=2483112 RepID=A0A3M2I0B7_9GAMM|nr:ABC transporter permease [Lysobacter pythonis]RMH93835.1 ABC transporter permease [Lysobacter pythonis]